jgi:hypothetical protein
MVRIESITYLSGGRLVRIKPSSKITLPIQSKGWVPAELKVRATKLSPLTKYQVSKKKKMPNPKCKCSVCGKLVNDWLGDKCLPCYNDGVAAPLHLEIQRLKEVNLETNRIWANCFLAMRARAVVRLADWVNANIIAPPYKFIIHLWMFAQLFFLGLAVKIKSLKK